MSLHDLLLEAAGIIERNAEALRECHAVEGEWPESEAEVKEVYDEEKDVVVRLRESARIFDPKNWKVVRRRTYVEKDRRERKKGA